MQRVNRKDGNPQYRIGPRVPIGWKLGGLGLLALIAISLAAFAIL